MDFYEELDRYNGRHADAPVERRPSGAGQLVLGLGGELDMRASSDLSPLLESALHLCSSHGSLILDLRSVGYITSTGVGLLASTLVAAERLSIHFVLRNIPARVWTIMTTLGLSAFFSVDETLD